jgi:hypothetical protein
MVVMRIFLTALVFAGLGVAQSTSESPDPAPDGTAAMPLKQWDDRHWDDKHILGVVPNYGTVNEPSKTYEPLTAGEKFMIATHDSFDPYNWVITGLYAGVYQKENEYAFPQGGVGYAQRYAVTFADATISTYISEGIFPVMLHEDPRYFRLGEGTKWHRIAYALTRVLVTRTDSGGWRFNNSEIEGNLIAAGISNLYYPPVDRGLGFTIEKFGIGVISDAGFNVLKEFWPDWRHSVLHK